MQMDRNCRTRESIMYLCLTSNMLECLGGTLVSVHPPEELEPPEPDPRHLAVLHRVLDNFVGVCERPQGVEHQSKTQKRQSYQHPVEENQGFDYCYGVVLVCTLDVVTQDPHCSQYVPGYFWK